MFLFCKKLILTYISLSHSYSLMKIVFLISLLVLLVTTALAYPNIRGIQNPHIYNQKHFRNIENKIKEKRHPKLKLSEKPFFLYEPILFTRFLFPFWPSTFYSYKHNDFSSNLTKNNTCRVVA